MLSRNASRALCLLGPETALTCGCGIAAIYIRFHRDAHGILFKQHGWLKVLVMAIIVQGAFYLFDLYDLNRIRKRPMLLLAILQAVGLASIGMAVVFYLA